MTTEETCEREDPAEKVRLSVVIPCYNARETLGDLLEALARQTWDGAWEALVVDNGSTDGSAELAVRYEGRLPALRVVKTTVNKGAAHARNAGVAAAAGEHIAFCDADDVVDAGWVGAMARALEENVFVASRVDVTRLNSAAMRLGRGAPQSEGLQPYHYPPFLPHAGGSGLGVHRSVHERIGGFDESLRVLEDTDYCWRIQLTDVALAFAPEALVHVRLRGGLKDMCRQSYLWGAANVRLYKRYRPFGMPALSVASGMRCTLGVMLRAHRLLDRRTRAAWLWQASWQTGRLAGSLRHRVFAL